MITVYLVRHGQTFFNYFHKIQGRCDSPLTPLGIAQAEATRDYVKEKHVHFDYAFSSSSERASDTLEIITEHKMPFKRDKGLKEFAFGRYEAHDESLNPKPPYNDFFKQFGGESQVEVEERMDKTIRRLLKDIPNGKNVLIVSHGGALMNFLRKALNSLHPLGKLHYHNCGIVVLNYDGKNFTLKSVANPADDVSDSYNDNL